MLGTKTAPVRKLYEHNGVLYTIHSDKVTAWRHAAPSIVTISETAVKPLLSAPFSNSIRIAVLPPHSALRTPHSALRT